jgi:hypothetical protein
MQANCVQAIPERIEKSVSNSKGNHAPFSVLIVFNPA